MVIQQRYQCLPTSSTRVTLAEKWGETPAILQDEKRAGNYTHRP